jgi:hypothetical protein
VLHPNRTVTEREMEDLLWQYPERFLNEPLNQFRRQPCAPVGRADLIFRGVQTTPTISIFYSVGI